MSPILRPPPIGVMPKWLWDEKVPNPSTQQYRDRLADLKAAIRRCDDAKANRGAGYCRWWMEVVTIETWLAAFTPQTRKCRLKRWVLGWVRRVVARLRLNRGLVCAISQGDRDYHDYHDTAHKTPDHFVPLVCERCDKEFWL
ncbi:MAG TPA: hypothetical protein VMZ71_02260 [Gemmataceae bacterium]|nr:hypothetical protein [Gemmataceae bacterium]